MVELINTLKKISPSKVLVAGDLMLDMYTIGRVQRISPEAPVAVVQVEKEDFRPGGAGNVILNLLSLGVKVTAIGRVGDDKMGRALEKSLKSEGVDLRGVVVQNAFQTPVKNRIVANQQQIVRLDYEQSLQLSDEESLKIESQLPYLLEGVDVIAISDYGKGFLTKRLLSKIIHEGRLRGIPIVVDPKGLDFSKYSGATLIKPNLSETYLAANLPPTAPLEVAVGVLMQAADCQKFMVTRSEAGISLFYQDGKRVDYPVKIREVKDVTGAGDTVLAVLSFALSNQLNLNEATELCNLAAGIAIERFGCARVTLEDLSCRLMEHDMKSKVVQDEHSLLLLKEMLSRSCSLLSLSGQKGLTSCIFKSIQTLKMDKKRLVVFIRDEVPCLEFVEILSSFSDIDWIFTKREKLLQLSENLTFDAVYTIGDNNLAKLDNVEQALYIHEVL